MKLTFSNRFAAKLQQISHRISHQMMRRLNRGAAMLPHGFSPRLKRSGLRLVVLVNRSRNWLLGGLGLLLLWVWLWQWLLAVAAGLTVTAGLYLAQQGRLRLPYRWRKLWSPANRSLSLAVLGGLVALGSTYLAMLLWASESHGLAAGLMLQTYGLLAVLGLLLWQGTNLKQPAGSTLPLADLTDLTHEDPLRRLIAVRQLTEAALAPVSALPASHLADCFRLMLNRETEPLVCSALLDGLQRLSARADRRPARSQAARSPARQLPSSAQVVVQLNQPHLAPEASPNGTPADLDEE